MVWEISAEYPEARLTVSIGVATFPDHALTRDELLAHADAALYQAKRNGRNQVVVYTADVPLAHPGTRTLGDGDAS